MSSKNKDPAVAILKRTLVMDVISAQICLLLHVQCCLTVFRMS